MIDYPAIVAIFKNTYECGAGVLSIEGDQFSQAIQVLYDSNEFDRGLMPAIYNGLQINFVDVRAQLNTLNGIKLSLGKVDSDSDLVIEIKRYEHLLDQVRSATANRIIFLDIDGVLNSYKYFKSRLYQDAVTALSDEQMLLEQPWHMVDPDGVKRINHLVDVSGAQVVLSSSWRVKHTPVEMTKMLRSRGATFKVTASTPKIYGKFSEIIPRGNEIKAYLKSLSIPPDSFVILDDLNDMEELTNHLVRTFSTVGITDSDIQNALKILEV